MIKIVFVIIVLSFIGTIFLVWGRGDDGINSPTGYAAKVDDSTITIEDFQNSYYRTRGLYEQIYGSTLTPEMEKQMDLKKQTIDGLIDNVLISKEAKRMNLKVTKDDVAAEIAKNPAFQKNGAFDFNQYQATLKANRITPKAYEEAQEEGILVQKARQQITDKVTVSDQEILQAFKKQNDKIELQYAAFGPAEVKGEVKLTEQELNSYLQENQAQFKTAEQVSIAYALVSPAQAAAGVAVTPQEAESYYQKNIDRYQGKGGILPFAEVKEQVTADAAKQKAAKVAYEKAAEAANKFRGQGDIDAAAAALGAKVQKTPLFAVQAPPPALEGETEVLARAFTIKQGELGAPVETAKGIYLVKVLEKKRPEVPALAQIRPQVEAKLLAVKAAELAKKKAEEALAQLPKGGVALKDTPSFGFNEEGTIPGIGASPELIEEAFTLTTANPVAKKAVKVGDRWYAVKLKSRTDAPTTELAAKTEGIKQGLLPKKQQEALQAWVKELRSKAKIEINPAILAD